MFLPERVPGARKAPNAIDRRDRFQQECIAKTGRLTVVIRDGVVQLILRNLQEPDGHFTRYFASTSCSETAWISPRR